jgi:hypothetical protein
LNRFATCCSFSLLHGERLSVSLTR